MKPTMASARSRKPHLVCIPYPAQGHINPMFKLAKLLHFKGGFHITFVHTEFNYQRLLKSRGLNHLQGQEDFQFQTIPDGLQPEDSRGVVDLPVLTRSMLRNSVRPFKDLLLKLNSSVDVPLVTCVLSDGVLGFTLQVAEELGLPSLVFFTPSACGFLGYMNYEELVERGYFPLKDESYLTNGYQDEEIDLIPAIKGIRLRDLPTFLRTTDPNDFMFNYNSDQVYIAHKAKGVILNTFSELEKEVLHAISSKFHQVYTIGPLNMPCRQMPETEYKLFESNLWEEDITCIEWLDKKDAKIVLYVNFGSLAVMTSKQLTEFAWGLANSQCPFLWVIRPDLVDDAMEIVSGEFAKEIKGRGLLVSWYQQEDVLRHASVGGFLTHCGWNSTLESISEGVPMICWPFFAEQQTNCFYLCQRWGIGMEINYDFKREEIERMVTELMAGENGEGMRNRAMDWMTKAEQATTPGGCSCSNLESLVRDLVGHGLSNKSADSEA